MTELPPLRIFLSYGRDEHAAFAEKVKNDLIKQGHEVWFDKDKLKGGEDWEQYIEDGILWLNETPETARVVFVITPHSARRPDGYCLNELAKLLMQSTKIIPVMLVHCEPPLSIYRLQWLDAQDCKVQEESNTYNTFFEQLVDALLHDKLNLEGLHARLMSWLKPIDFGSETFKHLKFFTGRLWMLNQVEEWLKNPNGQKVFVVKGSPGSGKSAFSAYIIHNLHGIIAYHLFKANDDNLNKPIDMVKSIAFQISTQIPEYQEKLAHIEIKEETDARTLFNELITRPLFRLNPPKEKYIILLDALDEAKSSGLFNEIAKIIAEEFPKTPAWLRLIVTTRPEPDTINMLARFNPVSFIQPDENLADMRNFLQKRLKHDNKAVLEKAIETIIAKSEGNFLYASAICDEIDNNCYSIEQPKEFPFKLADLFSKSFEKRFGTDEYATHIAPVLEALITAFEPLSFEYLSILLNIPKTELNRTFILKMGSFCNTQDNLVQLFHKSLADWLVSREEAIFFYIDGEEAIQAMAQKQLKLLQMLFGEPDDIEQKHNYCINWALVHLYKANLKKDLQQQMLKIFDADDDLYKTFEPALYNLVDWVVKNKKAEHERLLKNTLNAISENAKNKRRQSYFFYHQGNAYKDIGYSTWALEFFEKLLKVMEELVALEPDRTDFRRDLSVSLNNVGQSYKVMGQGLKALEFFEKMLTNLEALVALEPDRTDFRRDLSVSFNNVGNIYSDMGQGPKALEFFEKSLKVMEELVALEPDRTDFRRDLSVSFNNVGNIYSDMSQGPKALEFFEKSLKVMEELVALEPDRTDFRRDLSVSLNNVGNIYKVMGQGPKALEFFEKDLKVMEELVALEPDRTDFRRELSVSFNNVGNIYSDMGQGTKALEFFEKSLKVREELIALEPDRTDFRRDLSVSFNNVGNIYSDMGQGPKALEFFEKDLKVMEELVAIEPDRTDFRVDYAISHWNIYLVCAQEDKLNWLTKAKTILQPMIEQGVVHGQLQQLWGMVNEAIEKIENK